MATVKMIICDKDTGEVFALAFVEKEGLTAAELSNAIEERIGLVFNTAEEEEELCASSEQEPSRPSA